VPHLLHLSCVETFLRPKCGDFVHDGETNSTLLQHMMLMLLLLLLLLLLTCNSPCMKAKEHKAAHHPAVSRTDVYLL
jgi:hypothetical protein